MATLLKNLGREGFSIEKLNKIHTPIGLQINSRTPEEIAVSIAAEIIAVKNAKD
jgi:xanthine dehydrogenase accessory factor